MERREGERTVEDNLGYRQGRAGGPSLGRLGMGLQRLGSCRLRYS